MSKPPQKRAPSKGLMLDHMFAPPPPIKYVEGAPPPRPKSPRPGVMVDHMFTPPVDVKPEEKPPEKTWTEQEFEQEFGIDIADLPEGSKIVGYTVVEEPTKLPKRYWTQEQFEQQYYFVARKLDLTGLPEGAMITGYNVDEYGHVSITYLPPLPPISKTYQIQYITGEEIVKTQRAYEIASIAKLATYQRVAYRPKPVSAAPKTRYLTTLSPTQLFKVLTEPTGISLGYTMRKPGTVTIFPYMEAIPQPPKYVTTLTPTQIYNLPSYIKLGFTEKKLGVVTVFPYTEGSMQKLFYKTIPKYVTPLMPLEIFAITKKQEQLESLSKLVEKEGKLTLTAEQAELLGLPKGVQLTKLMLSGEAWQIEYLEPSVEPTTTKAPPKDWIEWFGRAFEGLRFPTPVEELGLTTALGMQKETYTQRMIIGLETLQLGIREMPIKGSILTLSNGRVQYEKATERFARYVEPLYIPVGMVRTIEATVGFEPSLVGAAIYTAISPLPGAQVGPLWIGGKGAFTTEALTQYWETTRKHPGLMVGEVVAEVALAKYVWGPAVGKAWEGAKWIGSKVKKTILKFAFPKRFERALFERAVIGAKAEEETFSWLVKTEKGWSRQTAQMVEKTVSETGKKTAWKPLLWKKAESFKPTTKAWYPPELLRGAKPLPREFATATSKGMALVTTQVTKQVIKQSTMSIAKVAATSLAVTLPKTVPYLVAWPGKPYPSPYKQKKEVTTLLIAKLPVYPQEKPLKLPPYPTLKEETISLPKIAKVPKSIKLPSLPTTQTSKELQKIISVREVQLPKTVQVAKVSELQTQITKQLKKQVLLPKTGITQVSKLKQPSISKVSQIQRVSELQAQVEKQLSTQMAKQAQVLKVLQVQRQKQLQEQTEAKPLQFRLEFPKRKGKKPSDLFGEWFKRTHPIMEPKELLATFGLGSSTRRKRKRR